MITKSKWNNNYYCKRGGHWIPKHQAKVINNVPFCPECKKKLQTKKRMRTKDKTKMIMEIKLEK